MNSFSSRPGHETDAVNNHNCNCSTVDVSQRIAVDSQPQQSPSALSRVQALPGRMAIQLVRGYQYLISPLLGPTCRFYPSCSQYFILSVKKSGLIKGIFKGTWRICRCHPWNAGGYDPP